MRLVPQSEYIEIKHLDNLLTQLGYEESIFAAASKRFFRRVTDQYPNMPETLTIAHFDVAMDGTLFHRREDVFDLLDSISDLAPDGIIIRAIKDLAPKTEPTTIPPVIQQ